MGADGRWKLDIFRVRRCAPGIGNAFLQDPLGRQGPPLQTARPLLAAHAYTHDERFEVCRRCQQDGALSWSGACAGIMHRMEGINGSRSTQTECSSWTRSAGEAQADLVIYPALLRIREHLIGSSNLHSSQRACKRLQNYSVTQAKTGLTQSEASGRHTSLNFFSAISFFSPAFLSGCHLLQRLSGNQVVDTAGQLSM